MLFLHFYPDYFYFYDFRAWGDTSYQTEITMSEFLFES